MYIVHLWVSVSKLLFKTLKKSGHKIDPCGTPLAAGHQSDITLSIITPCGQVAHTSRDVCI